MRQPWLEVKLLPTGHFANTRGTDARFMWLRALSCAFLCRYVILTLICTLNRWDSALCEVVGPRSAERGGCLESLLAQMEHTGIVGKSTLTVFAFCFCYSLTKWHFVEFTMAKWVSLRNFPFFCFCSWHQCVCLSSQQFMLVVWKHRCEVMRRRKLIGILKAQHAGFGGI